MAWARRRLRPDTVDRLIAAGLAVWALFDVPWWRRPPGHGGPSLAVIGTFGLAAAQSLPFARVTSPLCVRSAWESHESRTGEPGPRTLPGYPAAARHYTQAASLVGRGPADEEPSQQVVNAMYPSCQLPVND